MWPLYILSLIFPHVIFICSLLFFILKDGLQTFNEVFRIFGLSTKVFGTRILLGILGSLWTTS